MNEREFEKQNVFGKGEYNSAYAKYFSGASYLNPLTEAGKTVFIANVTFEPSCRNNRHMEEGKDAVSLTPGTVITIPANVKHWHGAKKDSWFSHIAIEVPGKNCRTEWCEPVSDEEYEKL